MKTYALVLLSGVLIGALVVHFLFPTVEESIEYRDRVKVETRIVTRTVTVRAPDGSTRTETETVDNSNSTQDTSLVSLKLAQKQYLFGVGVRTSFDQFSQPDYVVHVGRRIVGPFLGAISVGTDRRAEAAVYFEF